jgi:hypothetical protein
MSNSSCNLSRFSGPCTLSYVKGILKKRHLHTIFHIQFLRRSQLPRFSGDSFLNPVFFKKILKSFFKELVWSHAFLGGECFERS